MFNGNFSLLPEAVATALARETGGGRELVRYPQKTDLIQLINRQGSATGNTVAFFSVGSDPEAKPSSSAGTSWEFLRALTGGNSDWKSAVMCKSHRVALRESPEGKDGSAYERFIDDSRHAWPNPATARNQSGASVFGWLN